MLNQIQTFKTNAIAVELLDKFTEFAYFCKQIIVFYIKIYHYNNSSGDKAG